MRNVIQRIMPKILSWKEKYSSVYYIKIGNGEYIFRPLTRGEFSSLLSIQENLKVDNSDLILTQCLLYPKFTKSTFDKKKAGEVDSLIRCIGKVSGFSNSEQILDDIEASRQTVGLLENQIITLICKAFPHLTLHDVNNLTYEEMIRYLTIAESLLDVKINIEKPKPQKPGTIDFDEENKAMGTGPIPFGKTPLSKPRGDAGK